MWSAADCVIKMYELCNFIRPAKLEQIREESWSDIQKQLKEMTDSTLVNKTLSHPFFTVFCDEGEDFLSSHRWALRRSGPCSSPGQPSPRHRCQSCRITLTTTWLGQEVTWCVSHIMFILQNSVILSYTTNCRYKEEISRLCRLHGIQEAGRSQSANSSLR